MVTNISSHLRTWYLKAALHCVCVCVRHSVMSSHLRTWCLKAALQCVCVCVLDIQSCPTLRDPMDCSPPGFSVHGILQATILEWVAIPSSRGSSWPRDRTCVFCNSFIDSLPLSHQGSPHFRYNHSQFPVLLISKIILTHVSQLVN